MPKAEAIQSSSRQRPVSCQFCRRRKLRCSREAPCSNCVSRSVHCDLQDIKVTNHGDSDPASQSAILDRLEKLEAMLAAAQKSGSVNSSAHSSQLATTTRLSDDSGPDVASELRNLDQDVALLESIYLRDSNSSDRELPPTRVMFRTCSVQDLDQAKLWFCAQELSLQANAPPVRCIWLPHQHEAAALLQKFVRVAAHYPWVMHVPSLPKLLTDAYAALQQRKQVKPGPLILLLTIFACALNSWTGADSSPSSPYPSVAVAIDRAKVFVDAAFDIVNISKDNTLLPIEAVQGLIVLAFLLIKLEGLSRRCRFLFATCFWMARELGLHRIDHPSNKASADTVEAEIARRAFWYLAASDWQAAARFDGANEGLYFWQHRQIITRRPRHVNDDNIFEEKPMSFPTDMSYPLHRIKISEICRKWVDRQPLSSAHLGGPSSEDIMDVDMEFEALLSEVQPFFSMSQEDLIEKYQLRQDKASDIVQQGHTLRFLLFSQRCKIHLPYLTKGYTLGEYRFSRTRCVESARMLIQSQSHLLEAGAMNGTLFPFAGLLLGVFMASIVLFVDLCMLKAHGQENLHRTEVCQALRLLESARHESETIARFVDSLTVILRKHKITPPKYPVADGSSVPTIQASNAAVMSDTLMTPDSNCFAGVSNEVNMGDFGTNDEDLSAYFRDLAENFGQGNGIGEYDWDNILSDLNTSFV